MNTEKLQVVLVISTGTQDIKLWMEKNKQGKTSLDQLRFPSQGCRDLHEFLWPNPRDPDSFRAVIVRELDPRAGDIERRTAGELAEDADWQQVFARHEYKSDTFLFRNGKLLMQPSKTMSLAAAVHPQVAEEIEVVRVLVLYTARGQPGEPVRNGVALGHWLHDEFPDLPILGEEEFVSGQPGIRWVNFLPENLTYEGSVGTVNYPLRADAASRIDRAIANAATGLVGPYVLYSHRGGFDDTKPVIAGACELHFEGRTHCFWETERTKPTSEIGPIDRDRLRKRAEFAIPADALPARALALGRLREGDILGAWGAVAHLDGIREDREWLDWLSELAAFFRGAAAGGRVRAEVFAGAEPTPVMEALFVRAFQVEAALQGADDADLRLPEALISTTACFDLALELGVVTIAQAADISLDREIHTIAKKYQAAAEKRVMEQVARTGEWCDYLEEENKKSKTGKPTPDPNLFWDNRVNTMRSAAKAWRIWLETREESAGPTIAAALKRLGAAVSKMRHYRNQLAHRALSPKEANKALAEACKPRKLDGGSAEKDALWRRCDDPQQRAESPYGGLFLASGFIEPIFAALGFPKAAQRYERLLCGATAALKAPIKIADEPAASEDRPEPAP